ADHHQAFAALFGEQLGERGGGGLPGFRVADTEPGVAVLAARALADFQIAAALEPGMELRAPGAGDAVYRPAAAVLGEVRRGRRVPVPGVDHGGTGFGGAFDLAVDDRDQGLSAAHVEAAGGIREIVLDVDHD